MKATLEFDLPEDRNEHLLAIKGLNWQCVVWDIDQYLRAKWKYGHEYKTTEDAIEEIRDRLREYMSDHGVSFEEVE